MTELTGPRATPPSTARRLRIPSPAFEQQRRAGALPSKIIYRRQLAPSVRPTRSLFFHPGQLCRFRTGVPVQYQPAISRSCLLALRVTP